jgi:hypothetical protein
MRKYTHYDFAKIGVGEAFKYYEVGRSLQVAANNFARTHGWVLRTKKLGRGVILVWREA